MLSEEEQAQLNEDLLFAAGRGEEQTVLALLERGAALGFFDEIGNNAFIYAARGGHIPVMRLLLYRGADVNALDESKIGCTALQAVAQFCTLEVAKFLLDAGADPGIAIGLRRSALAQSAQRKRGDGPKIHQLFLSARPRVTPSVDLTSSGRKAVVDRGKNSEASLATAAARSSRRCA